MRLNEPRIIPIQFTTIGPIETGEPMPTIQKGYGLNEQIRRALLEMRKGDSRIMEVKSSIIIRCAQQVRVCVTTRKEGAGKYRVWRLQ